jgi:hypothetical protein
MYVIFNPSNGLYWSRHLNGFTSERSGNYTTYTTEAKAEQAIRRAAALKHRGLIVASEPATCAVN